MFIVLTDLSYFTGDPVFFCLWNTSSTGQFIYCGHFNYRSGHFDYWSFRLQDILPTVWLVILPTRQFVIYRQSLFKLENVATVNVLQVEGCTLF